MGRNLGIVPEGSAGKFRMSLHGNRHPKVAHQSDANVPLLHSILFGVIFALAVAELIFTIDAFVYLEKMNKWWSTTERARMAFLIFSCARTIFLSAIYTVTHCHKVKNLMNTMHTVNLSTIS